MSKAQQCNKALHIPSLTIKGFRGIEELLISKLGLVTLVTGKNGAGKTTVLEAVRVYAARGRYTVLNELLNSREEFLEETDDEEGAARTAPNWYALFYGRRNAADGYITIGPNDPQRQVSIRVIDPQPEQQSFFDSEHDFDEDPLWFRVEFQHSRFDFPAVSPRLFRFARRRSEADFAPAIDCNRLGPGLLDNAEVARFWDRAALTDDEDRAVAALQLITNEKVERVAVIGSNRRIALPSSRRDSSRVMVKIAGAKYPVSLKSFGDGATRFFGLALALANSRNGILVIDEVENGVHHSKQRELWTMVLQTAYMNNTQVFAATHSWDCMRGFAQATTELQDVEGVLVRIERRGDNTRAIEYSEEDLRVAAEQGIEVR